MKGFFALMFAVVVVTLLAVSLSAGASSDQRLVLGMRGEWVPGTNAGTGTFIVAGALSDSGTFTFTSPPSVPGKRNCIIASGDETATTSNGTFTIHVSGTSCGEVTSFFDGSFEISNGTGAFAGLSAEGRATAVVKYPSWTQTLDGKAHFD